MEHAPLLFSLIFFSAFAIYLFFGVYLLNDNPRARLNRAFLAVTISLCFWSLGFAMAISAPSAEVALIWRRISAIGWCTSYSLLLHFFLLRIRKEYRNSSVLWQGLLQLPAIISLFLFSFSTKISEAQYNLVWTNYGWANISPKNALDIFFYAYYGGYVLAILGLLLWWKRTASDQETKKQATLLFNSLLLTLILATFFDVLWGVFFEPLPQIAPLVIMIPIVASYHSVKRYNLLPDEPDRRNDFILDESARDRIYQYLGVAFLGGGLVSFVIYFLSPLIGDKELLRASITGSIIVFFLGFIILNLKWIKNTRLKDTLIMSVLLISIPTIYSIFAQYATITIWAFPISLMIVALVFNTRIQLILITVTAIVSQIFLWIWAPSDKLLLSGFDYVLRISIFAISFLFGSVVNNIYIQRIKDNVEQAEFQKLISNISHDFINVKQENIDHKINHLLRCVGEFFKIGRADIMSVLPDQNKMCRTHQWSARGEETHLQEHTVMSPDSYPWLMGELQQGNLVYSQDISTLSPEVRDEIQRLVGPKIKSIMIVPIEDKKEFIGFMGFYSHQTKVWGFDQRELLRILANVVGDGFVKIKAEQAIEFLAYYDELTGLPNRTLFFERVEQELQMAKQNDTFIALLLMDLDSFKTINDIMGFGGGDLILQQVASKLKTLVRETDVIARFGGDEFLIMLSDIKSNQAVVALAQKIMKIFDEPFTIYGQEFTIKGSGGVAIFPIDGVDVATLIKNAEIAMYKAKSNGKNQFVICTPHMKAEVQKNMRLANLLHKVLERNELFLHYQPQIDLRTNQIVGVEALLRWRHPDLGLIPPMVFIPLAEKNGLINSIGDWVLRTACEQNQKWQSRGYPPIRMAVNLSVIQFNDPRITDKIKQICTETGMDPSLLELEITESIAITEPRHTIIRLNDLKNLGASIAIDDFGTEYSSLNRLKSLPVDRIKIDMQFVQSIEESEKDRAITEVIITLAKSLGLQVLAEGVETVTQLEFLVERECNDAQGYYYYKPMSPEGIEEIFEKCLQGIKHGPEDI